MHGAEEAGCEQVLEGAAGFLWVLPASPPRRVGAGVSSQRRCSQRPASAPGARASGRRATVWQRATVLLSPSVPSSRAAVAPWLGGSVAPSVALRVPRAGLAAAARLGPEQGQGSSTHIRGSAERCEV